MNRQRGFGLLGLMGFIALMVTLCAIISVSSIRSLEGSLRGIHRLQALAAAEGAAVLLQSGEAQTSSTLTVGNCLVQLSPADAATSGPAATMTVQVNSNGKPTGFERRFRTVALPNGSLAVESQP